ncbi:MAG: response regulator transcription factor [Rikenellaceae bacterium]
MMTRKILIVDDEIDLLEILSFNLEKSGYDTTTASSAEEAYTLIKEGGTFSLLLLDVMMSSMSGFELAEMLHKQGYKIPIIFLTALDTEGDLLHGFKMGADDYISKPFSVREVLARVSAVLSRTSTGQSDILEYEDLAIDIENKTVLVADEPITLTKTEFSILSLLMSKPKKLFSREELILKVWGGGVYVEERTVDVHIARIRKKIEASHIAIINRSGYGYCLE